MRGQNLKQLADVLALIDKVYDCVLDPSSWDGALERFAELIDAEHVIVFDVIRSPDAGEAIQCRFLANEASRPELESYFAIFQDLETHAHELARDFAQKHYEELLQSGQQRLIDLEPFYHGHSQYQSCKAYMLEAFDLRQRCGTILNFDHWQIDRLGTTHRMPFDTVDESFLKLTDQVLRHFAKAMRLARAIEGRGDSDTRLRRLDHVEVGLAIISPMGYPLYRNTEFIYINDLHDLFKVNRNGALQAKSETLQEYLHRYISGKSRHGQFGFHPRKEALALFGASGKPLVVEISPLREHSDFGTFPKDTLLVQMLDIDRVSAQRAASLERYFPLSKGETEIASLIVQGHSNNEIAEMRKRSPETVKSQTGSLFQKTYTSSRVELAQLCFALAQSSGSLLD